YIVPGESLGPRQSSNDLENVISLWGNPSNSAKPPPADYRSKDLFRISGSRVIQKTDPTIGPSTKAGTASIHSHAGLHSPSRAKYEGGHGEHP
ncbi:hypothetical protein AB4Z22_43740, partial [Paenibacillus sp. TAF58]